MASFLSALRGGFLLRGAILIASLSFGTAFAAPQPIQTEFSDQDILVTLPEPAFTTTTAPTDPDRLADIVQAQIQKSRASGDPRFMGYAEGLLLKFEGQMTDRLIVLKATIDQSNHRFDAATAALNQVIRSNKDRQQALQARLMLANIQLVRGQYNDAKVHCDRLEEQLPGLIATSCQTQVRARTGAPEEAYQRLKTAVVTTPRASQTERLWAQGTLGDIAAQLGLDAAEDHWQSVLRRQPDDLYIRASLADWSLNRGDVALALSLTEGYEDVDSLAVIRAIALKSAEHPEADRLARSLEQRFEEAQWRGNLLHQRDFARFQLDIKGDAEIALAAATANWQDQREPADTRLLWRAATAADDTETLQSLKAWLAKHEQQDARFGGSRP